VSTLAKAMAAVVALGAAAAQAQQAGLKELLQSAEQRNVDQRITAEARAKAMADYDAAWMALFPSLTTQASYTRNQYEVALDLAASTNGLLQLTSQLFVMKPGVPGVPTIASSPLVISPYDQLDAIVRVDLPLIDTTRWLRIQAADIARDSATAKSAAMRDLVWRQVAASWYGYAAALAVRDSAKRSAQVSEEQAKLTEVREGAGVATGLDTLRAKSEVQRTRQVVADTETLVATTRRTLTTLCGVAPPDQVDLPQDDVSAEKAYADLEGNVETLPAVVAADKDAQSAAKVEQMARYALIPIVGAQFTERITNATGFSGHAGIWNTGVNLTWRIDAPTFQNMKSQAAVHEMAVLSAERARLLAKDQLYNDAKKLEGARFKVQSAQAQVEAARRASQVAKDRFAAGAGTQFDVMQAERDLFGAEVGQIQAKTELASYRALLKLSANLPLFE
jgi:outer membrane protein TolC